MSLRGAKRRGNLLVQGIVHRKPKGPGTAPYHSSPRVGKSHIPPGDSHVARLPRNDMVVGTLQKGRCRFKTITLTAGASPRPTVRLPDLVRTPPGLASLGHPPHKCGGRGVGGCRYMVPFIGGIATPVCGLVRNDSLSWFAMTWCGAECRPLSYISYPVSHIFLNYPL